MGVLRHLSDGGVTIPSDPFADILIPIDRLKADMPGEIHRIAELLEILIGGANWSSILEHWSFDYMKANAA